MENLYLITPQYLTPWLAFTKDNSRLFETFLKRGHTLKVSDAYRQIFEEIISPILARYDVKEENREYIFLFYVEGIIAVVKQWIREKCARPVEEIAKLIMQCVRSYEPS